MIEKAGEKIDFQNNSLSLIRLLAAFSVMYFHTTSHMRIERIPVLNYVLGYFQAVPFFFMLTGYLMWHSLRRPVNFGPFLRKRCCRIFPQVWISILLNILLIALIYDQKIQWCWSAMFFAMQALLLPFFLPSGLRGYGCGSPNGSLWTLGHQMQFYILAYIVYPVLHGSKKLVWFALLVGSVLVGMLLPVVKQIMPEFVGKVYGTLVINYLWLFLIGAIVSEYADCLLRSFAMHWWFFFALSVTSMLCGVDFKVGAYPFLRSVTLFAAMLGFAYRFPKLHLKTDLSFGIYLFHMVIVNAMIELGYTGKMQYLILVVFLSIALAFLSEKSQSHIQRKLAEKSIC